MRSIASVSRASCGTAKFSGMNFASGPRVERYSSSAPSAWTKNREASSRSGTVKATWST